MSDWDAIMAMIVTVVAVVVIAVGCWMFQSKMEANAFNAVTGRSVTMWQAMWIELRVQGN